MLKTQNQFIYMAGVCKGMAGRQFLTA